MNIPLKFISVSVNFSPVFLNILVLAISALGSVACTGGASSFSESLPPELSIDTKVSIPIWSHPSTDLDRVVNCFAAFSGIAFSGIAWEIGFRTSISGERSSGESSGSSLSLFSVKFTLIEKEIGELKHDYDDEERKQFSMEMKAN